MSNVLLHSVIKIINYHITGTKAGGKTKLLTKYILMLESVLLLAILLAIGYFFWFPTPNSTGIDRADWTWLLALAVPLMAARWLACRRAWTNTPIIVWILALLLVCAINTQVSPYPSRGWIMLARPAFGLLIVLHMTELARTYNTIKAALIPALALALLVALMALGATQWESQKSDGLRFIIDLLPRVTFIPGAQGGFNPNEIAGAMAWLGPLAVGLAFYPWKRRAGNAAACIAGGLLLALLLGQSRFAIAGVLGSLVVIILLLASGLRLRRALLAGVMGLIVLQAALFFNVLPAAQTPAAGDDPLAEVSARDESTFNQRLDIWRSGVLIIIDHPLTGAGMALFRSRAVRNDYPVAPFDMPYGRRFPSLGYNRLILPHAHNEFIQVGTDLGVPGLLIFIGIHITCARMLWACWRDGDRGARVVAVAVGAGLLAHGIYGLGDAITLWDRFAFVWWVMLGIAAAQYWLVVIRVKMQP